MTVSWSEFIGDPFGETFSPFTNLFQNVIGNGQVFYLVPLVISTFGIQIKTQNPVMTSMFMIGSGALLSSSTLFVGATDMSVMFTIFAALGIVSLFMSLIFQR